MASKYFTYCFNYESNCEHRDSIEKEYGKHISLIESDIDKKENVPFMDKVRETVSELYCEDCDNFTKI